MSRRSVQPISSAVSQSGLGAAPGATQLFLDRDLSLLEFQRRVLDEARDENNPLLERVKFLSILGSNLDEFFMVRVAGHKQRIAAGVVELDVEGPHPASHLQRIRSVVSAILSEARQLLHQKLIPALSRAGIHLLNYQDLTDKQRAEVDQHFAESILPILTPLAFDPVRPFPHISNLSLNLAVLLRDRKGRERFAQVKVPETLPHLVPVSGGAPGGQGRLKPHRTMAHGFVWLEEVIAANLQALFPGAEIIEAHPFRVTRDAEMAIQELEAADLLDRVELGVRRRHFGCVSRLAIGDPMPDRLAGILSDNLKVDAGDVYRTRVPLALSRLAELSRIERLDLRDAPLSPAIDAGAWPDTDLFSCIRRHDILLHHPYDSFDPVVEFLQQAAADPQVLAIKMTLYRVGRHSPVVKALLDAKHNGKQVAVVVELKARFDEESNVSWARALERAGVHVVYGHVDLKVHAKLALVVRREGKKTRRYVHLSSGNYNVATAKVYTDIALFSCDEAIGADVMEVFNFLTGYSDLGGLTKLLAGPVNLRERLCQLIRREIDAQQQGASGRLIFKMNALVDPDIIQLLYQASQAGVRVDLLVRGICCLRPGVPGLSEHIQVSSIVGRFLEHSRIYYFRNGGSEQIYLGSADLMPRNLDRRVEVLFPVEDPGLLGRLRDEILAVYLTDTVKARRMQSDGSYVRVAPVAGEPAVSSQHELLQARGGRTFRSPAAAT